MSGTLENNQDKPQIRESIRHSAAHIMADVVKRVFPDVKLGIGPPTADGFYYDFQVSRPFTPDDLKTIGLLFPKTKQNITLEGLKSSITILPGEKALASFWGPGRKYLREIYHLFYIIFFAIKFRPNIIYIGNANIWIGAIFSYFGKWKVVFHWI